MRVNNNKFDFAPILKAYVYQRVDPYNSKTMPLGREWHTKLGKIEGEEYDSVIKNIKFHWHVNRKFTYNTSYYRMLLGNKHIRYL